MTRRATQLRLSEVLLSWAIITIAAMATAATCALWLAREVSHLTSRTPQPGNPAHYARSLLTRHAAWPDPATLVTAMVLAIATAASASASEITSSQAPG
jgi:hypothetical protein